MDGLMLVGTYLTEAKMLEEELRLTKYSRDAITSLIAKAEEQVKFVKDNSKRHHQIATAIADGNLKTLEIKLTFQKPDMHGEIITSFLINGASTFSNSAEQIRDDLAALIVKQVALAQESIGKLNEILGIGEFENRLPDDSPVDDKAK